MTCKNPKPRWGAGAARPVAVLGTLAGLLLLGGSVLFPRSSVAIPIAGAVSMFVGLSTAALHAYGFSSVGNLIGGARARLEAVTAGCDAELAHLRFLAGRLFAGARQMREAIRTATLAASQRWTIPAGPGFRIFLFCHVVQYALAQAPDAGVRTVIRNDPGLYRVLHRECRIPVAAIATILDRNVDDIRRALAASDSASR